MREAPNIMSKAPNIINDKSPAYMYNQISTTGDEKKIS